MQFLLYITRISFLVRFKMIKGDLYLGCARNIDQKSGKSVMIIFSCQPYSYPWLPINLILESFFEYWF